MRKPIGHYLPNDPILDLYRRGRRNGRVAGEPWTGKSFTDAHSAIAGELGIEELDKIPLAIGLERAATYYFAGLGCQDKIREQTRNPAPLLRTLSKGRPTSYGDRGLIRTMAVVWFYFDKKPGTSYNGVHGDHAGPFVRACEILIRAIDPNRRQPLPKRSVYRRALIGRFKAIKR